MSTATAPAPAVAACRRILETFCDGYSPRDFAVRFWDGTVWEAETPHPRFTLVLNHPGTAREMFDPFSPCGFGEAFLYNAFDVEGDMLAFAEWAWFVAERDRFWGIREKLGYLWKLRRLPRGRTERAGRQGVELSGAVRSKDRDRQAIAYHYELPAAAFALFLDRDMQYTCGYFRTPDDDLDTCQRQKLEHVCRKLRLKPGERLVDFGCGWGKPDRLRGEELRGPGGRRDAQRRAGGVGAAADPRGRGRGSVPDRPVRLPRLRRPGPVRQGRSASGSPNTSARPGCRSCSGSCGGCCGRTGCTFTTSSR